MTLPAEFVVNSIGATAGPMPLPACIGGWSIDSRTVGQGDCFFAIRGPLHDGHSFVPNAAGKGAGMAVVDHEVPASIPQLVVANVEEALQRLAAGARARWAGKVIAVTGSAGKTTTKDIIATLLSTAMATGRTIGNLNNHLGLPLSILRIPDGCEAAAIEMGMNHRGEIRSLARIAAPEIGVITNAGWAHAENFPDGIEGVSRAKRELIEELPRSGTAILNGDDARVREFARIFPGRSVLFGFSSDADVRAEGYGANSGGTTFRCLGTDFESPLPGRHAVLNVLAGIAVAREAGIEPASLKAAVRSLAPGAMRGERAEFDGVFVINDCYNSNPEAVRSMLETLRDSPAARRIAVLGEMLELGREAETLHREIGRFAAAQGIDALVGIRGAARLTVDEAVRAGMSGGAAYFFETPEAAGDFLGSFVRTGDLLLFKGSRGVGVERAIARAFTGAHAEAKG